MRSVYIKSIAASVMGLVFSFHSAAQNVKDTSGHLTASVNYQSNLHYLGRVDSLKSSGLFPIIGYRSKIGLYLNSSFIFVSNKVTPLSYTGMILEGGYYFPYSKNFSGNIYYDYFLYKDNSVLQQAALTGQAGVNMTYNNKVVNISGGGNVKFSRSETDYGASAGLDKLILLRKVIKKVVIALDPNFTINAGTHNYFQNVAKTNGLPILPPAGTSVQQAKEFTILSYDFSIPVVLVKGKMNAYFSPAYVIPQNLVTVPNRPDLSEKGSNLFYFAAGVGLRL